MEVVGIKAECEGRFRYEREIFVAEFPRIPHQRPSLPFTPVVAGSQEVDLHQIDLRRDVAPEWFQIHFGGGLKFVETCQSPHAS